MRLIGLGLMALLLSCDSSLTEPAELALGTADLRVSGSLTTNGDPTEFPGQLAGIGRSKLYELIAAGGVDVVKIGASTLITVASLRRLIQKSRR